MADDSWSTTSGLLDGEVGTVQEAYFATDAKVQNGEVTLLHLRITTPDGTEITEKYGLGKGWESFDGGKTVKHEGGASRFNKQAKYGKLINAAIEVIGVDALDARGKATEAKVWEGLTFEWSAVKETFKAKDGETVEFSTTLPVRLVDSPPAKANGATADKVAAAKAKAAAKANGGGDLRARVTAEAANHDTHEAFVAAVVEWDGVADDDELLAEIVDESGLYAQARG